MPSPIGHLLAGAGVFLASTSTTRESRVVLAVTMAGSILPDFDFVPGILIGEPAAFHHGISHSLAAAVLFGALVFVIANVWWQKSTASHAALLGSLAYGLHILLDFISANHSVPILWPISGEKLGVNLNLFGHFHHSGLKDGVWSVLHWMNLEPVVRELIILSIPVLYLLRRRGSELVGYKENEKPYEC